MMKFERTQTTHRKKQKTKMIGEEKTLFSKNNNSLMCSKLIN